MDLDTSKTWQIIGNTETATYYVRTDDDAFNAGVAVEKAKRRAPSYSEMSLAGALLANGDLVWHLWKDKLGDIVPKVNDLIKGADGTRWIVKALASQSIAERQRLICQQETGTPLEDVVPNPGDAWGNSFGDSWQNSWS